MEHKAMEIDGIHQWKSWPHNPKYEYAEVATAPEPIAIIREAGNEDEDAYCVRTINCLSKNTFAGIWMVRPGHIRGAVARV